MEYYALNHEATLEDLKQFNYPNQKAAVIAHIENSNGEILLQQRGIKSRDENGLFEDIGGKVEEEDADFKSAIIREIQEEAGDEVNIELGDSIGLYHCLKGGVNWIFVIYFGKYISGDFKIMEPEKCQGYKFISYEDAINSKQVTQSCKYLIESVKKNMN